MKYGYWGFGMLLFGCIGLVIIVMFESITLDNDSEYYVLKEAMEASMLESVDTTCFRITKEVDTDGCDGQLKISEQKFVENFTRRFAASISGDVDDYTIDFYDIMEMPPKATVVIKSSNKDYKIVVDSVDITNGLSGILEAGWGEYTLSTVDDDSSGNDTEFEVPTSDNSSYSEQSSEVSLPCFESEGISDGNDDDVSDEDIGENADPKEVNGEDDVGPDNVGDANVNSSCKN
jgi:hypothetical protein